MVDYVPEWEVGSENDNILIVTRNGYGKKTFVSEYRMTSRGSKGVKAMNLNEKNGDMVCHKIVHENEDLLIITDSGMLIRLAV